MNYYAQAIDLLGKELDNKAIMFDYAKRHPKAFVAAATPAIPEWRTECKDLMHNGRKIDAIKLYRRHTDSSLKAALAAVEQMR